MSYLEFLQIIAAISGLTGQYFVVKKDVRGFYLWVLSNLAIMVLQYLAGYYWLLALHFAYLCLCLHGIRRWRADGVSVMRPRSGS